MGMSEIKLTYKLQHWEFFLQLLHTKLAVLLWRCSIYMMVILNLLNLKHARSYFSKLSFLSHLENYHYRYRDFNLNSRWNGHTVWMYGTILGIAVAYILLCKLNYGHHNAAHFHPYHPNRTLFSCKIWHGLWEQYKFSYDTKYPEVWKKLEKIRPCIFKCITGITELFFPSNQLNLSSKWSLWTCLIAPESSRSLQYQFCEVAKVADFQIPSYCIII